MTLCNKQHLRNIWGSIHWNVRQHWGWVEKKRCLYKKCVLYSRKANSKKKNVLKKLVTDALEYYQVSKKSIESEKYLIVSFLIALYTDTVILGWWGNNTVCSSKKPNISTTEIVRTEFKEKGLSRKSNSTSVLNISGVDIFYSDKLLFELGKTHAKTSSLEFVFTRVVEIQL